MNEKYFVLYVNVKRNTLFTSQLFREADYHRESSNYLLHVQDMGRAYLESQKEKYDFSHVTCKDAHPLFN